MRETRKELVSGYVYIQREDWSIIGPCEVGFLGGLFISY